MKINEILNINKTASAKIHVSSSAIYNSQALDFCYNLNLNETVKWVSLMYKALGNFTAEVDLIVNGNIVKSFVVENLITRIQKEFLRLNLETKKNSKINVISIFVSIISIAMTIVSVIN